MLTEKQIDFIKFEIGAIITNVQNMSEIDKEKTSQIMVSIIDEENESKDGGIINYNPERLEVAESIFVLLADY